MQGGPEYEPAVTSRRLGVSQAASALTGRSWVIISFVTELMVGSHAVLIPLRFRA